MITIYDVKTGEPIELDSIDARERVNAGLAVRNKEDLTKKDQVEKPVSDKKKGDK